MERQLKITFPKDGNGPPLSQRYPDLVAAAAEAYLATIQLPEDIDPEKAFSLLQDQIGNMFDRITPMSGKWTPVFPSLRFGIQDDPKADSISRKLAKALGKTTDAVQLPRRTHIVMNTFEQAVYMEKYGKETTLLYRRSPLSKSSH